MFSFPLSPLLQAYRKLAKEYHPDKNPDAGDKVQNNISSIQGQQVVSTWSQFIA